MTLDKVRAAAPSVQTTRARDSLLSPPVTPRRPQLDETLQVASVIADLDSDGVIMEEEKVEALRLMPVPTLSRDIVQKYAMSTREHSGKQLVIR